MPLMDSWMLQPSITAMRQRASPMGDPWHLSEIFLKPLGYWEYPNNTVFCPQKAMLAVLCIIFNHFDFLTVYTKGNVICQLYF